MMTLFGHFCRTALVLPFMLALPLGVSLLIPGVASGEPQTWGSGYYRLNPSQDRPFASQPTQERDPWSSGRDRYLMPERSPPQGWREDDRRTRPRDGSRDFYRDTRRRGHRPWGEIPPEWRNEDLDLWPPEEGRSGARRRMPSYDDGRLPPRDAASPRWEGEPYGPSDVWDYPYPDQDDRYRRDSAPYYYEDRPRTRRSRHREPYYYYYDGGNGWWE